MGESGPRVPAATPEMVLIAEDDGFFQDRVLDDWQEESPHAADHLPGRWHEEPDPDFDDG